MNFAFGVDNTLLTNSLKRGISAVGALVGPLYCMRLPPIVHLSFVDGNQHRLACMSPSCLLVTLAGVAR